MCGVHQARGQIAELQCLSRFHGTIPVQSQRCNPVRYDMQELNRLDASFQRFVAGIEDPNRYRYPPLPHIVHRSQSQINYHH